MAGKAKEQKERSALAIRVDALGWYNVGVYYGGMKGHRTPDIDRIAMEGVMRADWYGQQPM